MRWIVFLLWWATCTPLCQGRMIPCTFDLCEAEGFYEITWDINEGRIAIYFPPLHSGERISLKVILRSKSPESANALDRYALSWGGVTYALGAGLMKLVVPQRTWVGEKACLVAANGKPLGGPDGNCAYLDSVYADRHVSGSTVGAFGRTVFSRADNNGSEMRWDNGRFEIPALFALVTDDAGTKKDARETLLPIAGPFDGDLENTQLTIEGHSPVILCESTSAVLVAVDQEVFAKRGKPDDVLLGRSIVRVRDRGGQAQDTIRFYRMESESMRSGHTNSGLIRIRVFGDVRSEPVPDLAFHVWSEFSVQERSWLRKYTARQVRRDRNVAALPSWGTQYVFHLSAAVPDGASVRIDVPVTAKHNYTWAQAPTWMGEDVAPGALYFLHDPERVRASVTAELEWWQAVNHIEVTAGAQSQIIAQFVEPRQEADLREIWGSFDREVPSFNDFLRYVAGFYLYGVRDRAQRRTGVPGHAMEFLPEENGAIARIQEVKYRLRDFIKDDFLKVIFDDAMCWVETKPEPGMQISPGSLTTNHRMDFSPGHHSLKFFSPRYGTCSCDFRVLAAGPGAIECDLTGGTKTSEFQCSVSGPVLSSAKQ
jgi:hypothetical protein